MQTTSGVKITSEVQTTTSHGRCYGLRYVPRYDLHVTINSQFWKVKLDFFFHFESFWNHLLKYSDFFKLMTEVSRNLRDIFFAKYHRFWNLNSDFCPIEKVFCIFTKIPHIYFTRSLFLKKNRKTFLGAKTPILALDVCFFLIEKVLRRLKFYYKVIMSKISSKAEQLFGEGGRSVINHHVVVS